MTPRLLMTAGAALLGIAGLALLFAPTELQRLVTGSGSPSVPPIALQLWGAGLLGLGAANWIGRGLILGGIYSRALVLANLVHWTVGALTSVRAAFDDRGAAALWAAAVVYGAFALAFTWLLGRHPGTTPPSG